jgi:hypothetical protein
MRDMGCTALAPGLDAAERGRYVADHLPPGLFRLPEGEAEARVAWRVAPQPFRLAPATVAKIEALGSDLIAFYRVLNGLYTRSARGTIALLRRLSRSRQARGDRQTGAPEPLPLGDPPGDPARPDPDRRRLRRERTR